MAKQVRKGHDDFEDIGKDGKFAKVTKGMIDSLAWQKLTMQQMALYLLFKIKYTKNQAKGTDNRNDISFPKSEWSKLYHNNYVTFARDIDALISTGLIRVVQYQANQQKPTIYGFSTKWKLYGTDKFVLEVNEQRSKRTLTKEHRENLSAAAKKTNSARHTKD